MAKTDRPQPPSSRCGVRSSRGRMTSSPVQSPSIRELADALFIPHSSPASSVTPDGHNLTRRRRPIWFCILAEMKRGMTFLPRPYRSTTIVRSRPQLWKHYWSPSPDLWRINRILRLRNGTPGRTPKAGPDDKCGGDAFARPFEAGGNDHPTPPRSTPQPAHRHLRP